MNAKDLKMLMKKSEVSKIAKKMAFEAGLDYHPETDAEWEYIDFNNIGRYGGRDCIILTSTKILTPEDAISYAQDDCLKLLKKAINEMQNIMFEKIKMSKAMKKHEIRSAGIKYEV